MAGYTDYINPQQNQWPLGVAPTSMPSPDDVILPRLTSPAASSDVPQFHNPFADLVKAAKADNPTVDVNLPHPTAPSGSYVSPILSSPEYLKAQQTVANTPTGLTHPNPKDPSFFRKLGRVAEGVGNVLGDIFAPATMELIPGTQLNRELQVSRAKNELGQFNAQAASDTKNQADLQRANAEDVKAQTAASVAGKGEWKEIPNAFGPNKEPVLYNTLTGESKFGTATPNLLGGGNNEEEHAIDDYIAANKLDNTPNNRLLARETLKGTAPLGLDGSSKINSQITDVLKGTGIDPKGYIVSPTSTGSESKESLAAAQRAAEGVRANNAAARATAAPEDAQDRRDARQMGYAVNQDTGKLEYMSYADANKQHSTFEPMTPGSILKDRQAIRQLNDVQQNISRYSRAINNIKGNIPNDHIQDMAAILSDKGLGAKLDYKGIGLDIGMLNDAITGTERAKNWNSLTPEERDLVVGYIRAKSSVIAYQRALTGSSRSSDAQLNLEMNQLPFPGVGAGVANPQMTAFQENIEQASAGFPSNLPGLKTPKQIRDEIEQPKSTTSESPIDAFIRNQRQGKQ